MAKLSDTMRMLLHDLSVRQGRSAPFHTHKDFRDRTFDALVKRGLIYSAPDRARPRLVIRWYVTDAGEKALADAKAARHA